MQSAAIESLIAIGDAVAVPHLLDHLKDDAEYVAAAPSKCSTRSSRSRRSWTLVDALRDSDWWVRVRAADALGTPWRKPGSTRRSSSCATPTSSWRTAVEILNTVPDRRATDALITALEDDGLVGERAIDALARRPRVEGSSRCCACSAATCALPSCIRASRRSATAAVEPLDRASPRPENAEVRREALGALIGTLARRDLPAEARRLAARTALQRPAPPWTSAPRPQSVEVRHGRRDGAPRRLAPPHAAARRRHRARRQHAGPAPAGTSRSSIRARCSSAATRVLQRIGSGGFTVYLAEDVVARGAVLKVLEPQLSLDET